MTNFFRRMRQTLLKEGKKRRYFKYALGEIFLVVIGILIAFQVNSWNDSRKDQSKKLALLKALKVEFTSNLEQLDTVIFYDEKVLKSTFQLLNLNPEDAVLIERDSLRQIIQNTSWLWTFDPLNGALRSGISSGTIHLIKNDSLVSLLFAWPDLVADAKENEDRATEHRLNSDEVFSRFIRSRDYRSIQHTELGASKFTSDYQGLLNDPLFEDYISERNTHTLDAIYELNVVKEQNTLIIKLLENELNLIQK